MDTPTTPERTSHVRIAATGPAARLELDGRDISSQVAAYTLNQRAGQLPELLLLLNPATVEGWEGTARVAIGEAPDPGPAAVRFLAAIDPGELERAALGRHDLMDGRSSEFTRALLLQLGEWAAGNWSVLDENEAA
ncbi:hypothetical protein GCM10009760_16410 [Kitasatospora kazusensis]|uniref:Uncharacterized protein n=1 Tax=Kitasatospora kazusensis TaxID=407974 RepID=A0ABP5KSL6_9ACTN